MAAKDWRIEYHIVRRCPGGDYEHVSFCNPGDGFATIGEANDVLKMLQKADGDLGGGRVASFDIRPVAFHVNFGSIELEMPGEDSSEDH